jgi:geranylgeranyl diphosphate synthase type II
MDFARYWSERQGKVDRALEGYLPSAATKPQTIHSAMRYSIFAGGKRLRPVICLAAAEVLKGSLDEALPLACAMECVHTYSLIHDDLPCMDNDDFRRGKPTSHKVYGEGMAVLAGDGLLTFAFQLAAMWRGTPRYTTGDAVLELAIASGSEGMVGGQVADVEGEGKNIDLDELKYIHLHKTAALITASIRLGAMSANAAPEQLAALTEFGQSLGLAFQVIDDILDVTQTTEKLGKSAGKDVKAHKATYPALLGLDEAKKEADRLTAKALTALKVFGPDAAPLHGVADYLLKREN